VLAASQSARTSWPVGPRDGLKNGKKRQDSVAPVPVVMQRC
jgi:hypothetical protein